MNLYIGCGPSPVHLQHLQVLKDPKKWTFVDLYVKEPHIKNWDGRYLTEVEDESVDEIYSSHTLEHFEHGEVPQILKVWFKKLKPGGVLTVNVPDLAWVSRQIIRLDNNALLNGYYDRFRGEHGLLSIVYGSQSHDGEYHKGGFIQTELSDLLVRSGFTMQSIFKTEDAHDMGVIIAKCLKSP